MLYFNSLRLQAAASKPVDALFVLGGSVTREIQAAKLAILEPSLLILISRGGAESCTWLVFQRQRAPKERVWLERCAQSTFENFYEP